MIEVAAPLPNEIVPLNVRRSGQRVELDLAIPATLPYFNGHFRGFPVLPGVVQLHWSLAFGRYYFSHRTPVPVAIQVKFKSIIAPDDQVCLILNYEVERGRLSFEYRDGAAVRSSGIVTFRA